MRRWVIYMLFYTNFSLHLLCRHWSSVVVIEVFALLGLFLCFTGYRLLKVWSQVETLTETGQPDLRSCCSNHGFFLGCVVSLRLHCWLHCCIYFDAVDIPNQHLLWRRGKQSRSDTSLVRYVAKSLSYWMTFSTKDGDKDKGRAFN